MKKIKYIIVGIILIILAILLFKGLKLKAPVPKFSYQISSSETTYTYFNLKSLEKNTEWVNSYLDDLVSCYDESWHYDSVYDITISNYTVKKDKMISELKINYEKGNLCENQYVLTEDYLKEIQENLEYNEALIYSCEALNTCAETPIDEEKVKEVIELSKNERIDSKEIIHQDDGSFKKVVIYLSSGDNLEVFEKEDKIHFKVIDQNDHSKMAIFHSEGNKLFE